MYNIYHHDNPDYWVNYRRTFREAYRWKHANFEIVVPNPEFHRLLIHGWLRSSLSAMDYHAWGRWEYWQEVYRLNNNLNNYADLNKLYGIDVYESYVVNLPVEPIPQIIFEEKPHPRVMEMLRACLNEIPISGGWRGHRDVEYFQFFMDWLMFGLGHHSVFEPPSEPLGCEGASLRLCQIFNLDVILNWPYDYLGELLDHMDYIEECAGLYLDEFPGVANVRRVFSATEKDTRLDRDFETLGITGRWSLAASNFTLRGYVQSINPLLTQVMQFNFECFAPWFARPIFPFHKSGQVYSCWGDNLIWTMLGRPSVALTSGKCDRVVSSAMLDWLNTRLECRDISEQITQSAEEEHFYCLQHTEHDADRWLQALPIHQRRYIDLPLQMTAGEVAGSSLASVLENYGILGN